MPGAETETPNGSVKPNIGATIHSPLFRSPPRNRNISTECRCDAANLLSSLLDSDWNNLGFGLIETKSHIEYTWKAGQGWDAGVLVSDPHITLHIAGTYLSVASWRLTLLTWGMTADAITRYDYVSNRVPLWTGLL